MITQEISNNQRIALLMNCIKKYKISPIFTIPFAKSNRTILIIVVKDNIPLLIKVKDFREYISKIDKNIDIDWSVLNDDLLEIKFELNDV